MITVTEAILFMEMCMMITFQQLKIMEMIISQLPKE